jgi:hypothetical protein
MGDNLKVVLDEFSTISLAVSVMTSIVWHAQAQPCLELKTWPRCCTVSLSLSIKYLGYNFEYEILTKWQVDKKAS